MHVKSYTREGENVKEHWRSKPGHRGFVENVDYEDTRGTIFLPEPREDGPRMYSLEGGVEITVGLGQMILEALKQIAQGAGETIGVAAPYALLAASELLKNRIINNAVSSPVYSAQNTTVPVNIQKPDFVRRKPTYRAPMDLKTTTPNVLNLPYKNYLDKENVVLKGSVQKNKNHYRNEEIMKLLNYGKEQGMNNPKKLSQISKYVYPKNNFKQLFHSKELMKLIAQSPYLSKDILKWGGIISDFTNFWDLKSAGQLLNTGVDFEQNAPVIENSLILENYKQTGHLASIVKDKLISQNMDPETSPGIAFLFDSVISQDIAKSADVKRFIRQYKTALINRQLVSRNDVSINLSSTLNLWAAINHADVLFAYFDDKKNVIMVLLDTYDFNPGENIIVELGRSAQEAGLLDKYFSLFFVFVPVGTY